MELMAIDPGPEKSAWVRMRAGKATEILGFSIWLNDNLIECLGTPDVLVIEQIASFGMPVGAEVFETVYWSGRFAQRVMDTNATEVHRIKRVDVKMAICKNTRAKDGNIRAALIDRYGGSAAIKKGGALHGVSKDVWAALAVAEAWLDRNVRKSA